MIEANRGCAVIYLAEDSIYSKEDQIDLNFLGQFCQNVASAFNQGWQLIIMPAGGGAAASKIGPDWRGVGKKQWRRLSFAVGHGVLGRFIYERLSLLGLRSADVLLSRHSFASREQYFAVRDTLRGLIIDDVIPIIFENEILCGEELQESENELFAAYTGGMLNVDRVIFCTKGAELLQRNGKRQGRREPFDLSVGEAEECFLQKPDSLAACQPGFGASAVRLLAGLGIESNLVTPGSGGRIRDVLEGLGDFVRIVPDRGGRISGIRKWLCTGAVPRGVIKVSEYGAQRIRDEERRGSLLAKGIVETRGTFRKGDVVSVVSETENLLGYGIVKYDSDELYVLKGTEGIVVIHADYFYGFTL